MTEAEARQQFQERVMPQLGELGIEAFCMAGYVRDGDGKLSRFTFGGVGDNPAYADGLKGVMAVSSAWAQGVM